MVSRQRSGADFIAWAGWNDTDWRPANVFRAFLAMHVLIWWLLPALLQHNLPLDMIEQLAWGREWQLAFFKHPPLVAWTLQSIAALSGRWPPAIYLAGPLASGLALVAVWRLGRELLGPPRALLAVLMQDCVLYFTIFTPEFNQNVVLLPIWAALGLVGYRACFTPEQSWAGTSRWTVFGALAALGMLGKYTTALFLLPLLALAVLHPRLRRVWATPGPWLAIGVFLLLLLPHLLGLQRIGLAPFQYAIGRAPGASHWYDHIVYPLLFCAGQLGGIAPALLAFGLLAWPRGEAKTIAEPALLRPDVRAYLWTITWAPVGLAVAISLILGLHLKDMWGQPMWCFLGLFLMAEMAGPVARGSIRRFMAAVGIILATVAVVFAIQNTFGAVLLRKPTRGQFPGRELARVVERRWHEVMGDVRLGILVGDVWIAGNVAFYSADRPAVFIDADPGRSPWITPDALARQGAVLIWPDTEPPDWVKRFASAEPQAPIMLAYVPALGHAPARWSWALVRPRK